jgi:hypothetical protein
MATFIQIAAVIIAIIAGGIAVFQVLLALGYPLAEYSWGGKHKGVLPNQLRLASIPSAVLLLFMGYVFLLHADVIRAGAAALPTQVLVWLFTAFLGLNTLGNLASKSPAEKRVMTPISGIAFLCGLVVVIAV